MRLTSDHDREGGDSWESMLTMPSSASPKSRQWVVIKVVVMVDIIIVGCQWSFLRPFVRWLSLVFRQSQTELENGHDLDTCLYLLNYKQCFGYFLFLHYAELESDWSTSHILHWHIPRLVGSYGHCGFVGARLCADWLSTTIPDAFSIVIPCTFMFLQKEQKM